MQWNAVGRIILGLACWSSLETGAVRAQSLTVATKQGVAKGRALEGLKTTAFLSLPYAAPPVGELRWRVPEPAAAWKGVRDATQFGHRCEQWPIWKDYVFLDPGPSEDCLYLNVYVPTGTKPTAKLPVMVWIHGGGYTAGAASEPRYTNSGLVQRGVVLVTINYRLGVFGFLASKDLAAEGGGHAGNYALMDMVAALGWVKHNVGGFGGDAGNVTVFGESAGSVAVSTLLAMPDAHGLFQKAIGESGAAFSEVLPVPPLAERTSRDQTWVESLGAKSLAELRAMSAEAVIAAAMKQPVGWFGPVVDGHLLPESVPAIYAAGKQMHVPVMAGWNRDERAGTLSKAMTTEKWKAFAAEHYGARATAFLAAFPGATDEEAVRSADAYTTDGFIAESAWQWVQAQARTGGAAVFRYRFDLAAPPSEMHPEGRYAFHSDELEYVFGTLDTRQGSVWRAEDRELSERIMTYWTNFARTGDPNGDGLPRWPRYDATKQILLLDQRITSGADPLKAQYEFLAK